MNALKELGASEAIGPRTSTDVTLLSYKTVILMNFLPNNTVHGHRRPAAAAVVVLALHAGILWTLWDTTRSSSRDLRDPVKRVTLRLLPPIRSVIPQFAQPSVPMAAISPSQKPRRPEPETRPQEKTLSPHLGQLAPEPSAPPALNEIRPPPESTTTESSAGASRPIDESSIRKAAREALSDRSFARQSREMLGQQSLTREQRFTRAVTAAGRRDCLNVSVQSGAHGSSTMDLLPIPVPGLFAAPFIAADAISGKCAM